MPTNNQDKYQSTSIIMPEYGRHIQDMVWHCMTLENIDEQRRCARSIIKTMSLVAPEKSLQEDNSSQRQEGLVIDSSNIYWDHLAIISNFSLKEIYPEGTITQSEYEASYQKLKIPYMSHQIHFRYYGHIIEQAIEKACSMQKGSPEREKLEYTIARQMKRNYMTWNSDQVSDIKIFTDLYELSKEQILLTPENTPKLNVNPNSIERQTLQEKKNRGRNNHKKQNNKRR